MSIVTSSTSSSGSWNDGAGHDYIEDSNVVVSGSAVTMQSSVSVSDYNTSAGSICAGWNVQIWTKHPSNVSLSFSGSGSGSLDSVTYGGVAYGYLNGTSYSRGPSDAGGPGSYSSTGSANRSCSTSSSTQFYGETYYLVDTYVAGASVSISGYYSGYGGSGQVGGQNDITITTATSSPNAVINKPTSPVFVSSTSSATFASGSTDPDGGGICSYSWTVTGPNSYSTSSTSSSVNVAFHDPGDYTISLTVWDNEGNSWSTSTTFAPRPQVVNSGGTGPKSQGEEVRSCSAGNGNNETQSYTGYEPLDFKAFGDPSSGNVGVMCQARSGTRGAALDPGFRINAQPLAPTGTSHLNNFPRGLGNEARTAAILSYYIGFYSDSSNWYLIDADGFRTSFGSTLNTANKPSWFRGDFDEWDTSNHYIRLKNAGAPGEIWKGGNWTYQFQGSWLYRMIDPAGNIQEVSWGFYFSYPYITQVEDLSTGRKLLFT